MKLSQWRLLELGEVAIATIATSLQRRHRMAQGLFLALCLNVAIAPVVHAATGSLSRSNAYALGLLSLVVAGLAIYLTAVILQPERF